jgi:enoyl-CoA hydratase/carnithine racemase
MSDGRAPVTQPKTITVETRDAIEILTLNRPAQLNAVTPDMIAELTGYFLGTSRPADDARRDPARKRTGIFCRTKQALNVLIDAPSLDAALMMEDRQQVMLEKNEHAEAVAAFRERRNPSYSDQ